MVLVGGAKGAKRERGIKEYRGKEKEGVRGGGTMYIILLYERQAYVLLQLIHPRVQDAKSCNGVVLFYIVNDDCKFKLNAA